MGVVELKTLSEFLASVVKSIDAKRDQCAANFSDIFNFFQKRLERKVELLKKRKMIVKSLMSSHGLEEREKTPLLVNPSLECFRGRSFWEFSKPLGRQVKTSTLIEGDLEEEMRSTNTFSFEPSPKKKETKMTMEQFSFKRLLGKGAFGCVWLVKRKSTSKSYAMKIINVQGRGCRKNMEDLMKENTVLNKLSGDFVVKGTSRLPTTSSRCSSWST